MQEESRSKVPDAVSACRISHTAIELTSDMTISIHRPKKNSARSSRSTPWSLGLLRQRATVNSNVGANMGITLPRFAIIRLCSCLRSFQMLPTDKSTDAVILSTDWSQTGQLVQVGHSRTRYAAGTKLSPSRRVLFYPLSQYSCSHAESRGPLH